ncbi:MAG TPA: HipA N-terminal domain-containing protein [Fibrobacteria bacterium]|nr:HipA N-terminal domain-containing protein [Fibrobacteria bacterium]
MRNRKAKVLYNGELAGFLTETGNGYVFAYEDGYYRNPERPPISLTLPKHVQAHTSDTLFPFFFGLLAEGENKKIQCRVLKIDENDDFTRLLKTAGSETIGAITVREDDGKN